MTSLPAPIAVEIIDRVSDGVAALDREWRYTYVNRQAAELLGAARESLLGQCAWELRPMVAGGPFHQACLRAMTEQQPIRHEEHFEFRGKWLEIRLYPSREGLSVFFQDITERKASEATLLQSRAHLGALAAHLQAVREQEAKRIARGLHDELGGALTGLKMDLSWLDRMLARQPPGEEAGQLRERSRTALNLIDATIASVRKVCRDLRPSVLDQLGLAPAIAWQSAEFQTRTGIPCAVELPESIAVTGDRGSAVFHILQEILTNVARHAGATQVRVRLAEEDAAMLLEVTDNGCGMPADALTRQDCFGLLGMRERALAAGGNIEFGRADGCGTKIILRVPLEKADL